MKVLLVENFMIPGGSRSIFWWLERKESRKFSLFTL